MFRHMPATVHEPPTLRSNGRRKPAPPAFAEIFIRTGWRGVEAAYGARTDCNKRWLAECGGEDLVRRRRDYRIRLREVRNQRPRPC